MFGTVMARLQKYIEVTHSTETWKEILEEAGFPPTKTYRILGHYPDAEWNVLIDLASRKLGVAKRELLHNLGKDFGRYLIRTYKIMFFPSWHSLDVIEKAAPIVYKTIQLIDPNTPKNEVGCERIAPDEVVVHYKSPRRMCDYVEGIIESMGEHFNEKLQCGHEKCMRKGGNECEIHVKLLGKNHERKF